jgi:hypothetical protein
MSARPSTDPKPRRLRGPWLLPATLALLYAVLQIVVAAGVGPANDTYRYAQMTLRLLGDSPATAQSKALRAYCEDNAAAAAQRRPLDPMKVRAPYSQPVAVDKCVSQSAATGLAPTSARYVEIFSSRWGFPVLCAPFVALLGANLGLLVTSWLLTILGGLFVYLILRMLAVPGRFAAVGQAVYYASPIGWWGSYGLTDSPAVTLATAGLLGALLILRRRYLPGTAVLAGALIVGCFVRYSSFLLIGLALAGASLLILSFHRAARTPAAVLLGLSTVSVVWLVAMAKVFGWAGVTETLQDTFTDHFTRPDVIDPWSRFIHLNVAYWTYWVQAQLRSPWVLAAFVVGAIALLRRNRPFGILAIAVAATGFLGEAAHPVAGQSDRLMINIWILPALGLPLLVATRAAPAGPAPPTATSDPNRPAREFPLSLPRQRGHSDTQPASHHHRQPERQDDPLVVTHE